MPKINSHWSWNANRRLKLVRKTLMKKSLIIGFNIKKTFETITKNGRENLRVDKKCFNLLDTKEKNREVASALNFLVSENILKKS